MQNTINKIPEGTPQYEWVPKRTYSEDGGTYTVEMMKKELTCSECKKLPTTMLCECSVCGANLCGRCVISVGKTFFCDFHFRADWHKKQEEKEYVGWKWVYNTKKEVSDINNCIHMNCGKGITHRFGPVQHSPDLIQYYGVYEKGKKKKEEIKDGEEGSLLDYKECDSDCDCCNN